MTFLSIVASYIEASKYSVNDMQYIPHYTESFIQKVLPSARAVKTKWGVPVCVVLAQGALESSWGRHVIGNAYFGVKGKSSSGESVKFETHEFIRGKSRSTTDHFRAYATLAQAADAYGRVLRTNPNYNDCFDHSNDPEKFVEIMAKKNYATDPDYGWKLKNIIHKYALQDYDKNQVVPEPDGNVA